MADKPIVDIRTYTIRPRGVAEFFRLYEELALPIAIRHWGSPVAFYVSEIGPLIKSSTSGSSRAWPIWNVAAQLSAMMLSLQSTSRPRTA
jgi:hypothetical protein